MFPGERGKITLDFKILWVTERACCKPVSHKSCGISHATLPCVITFKILCVISQQNWLLHLKWMSSRQSSCRYYLWWLQSMTEQLSTAQHASDDTGLPVWLSSNESACHCGEAGSIPGSGRSPGEGNGNPLQYSCLGNPMDRGAWWGYSPWGRKQ